MLYCPNCQNPYNEGDKICQHCNFAFSMQTKVLASGTLLQKRYEIEELSHIGNTNHIYIAKDKKLYDRRCIVKQINEPIKSDTSIEKLKEAILKIAKLSFPNVAMILDHFFEDEYYFIVTEYITGKTLSKLFEESAEELTEEEVIHWAISICDIVNSIHSKNITHGDLNPHTIMLTDEGFTKLIDSGSSNMLREIATGDKSITGKFGFTAPERWHDKQEPPSDIFSIAATIYYLLSGFLPLSEEYLAGQEPGESEFNPVFPQIREINPRISSELEIVLQKALQLDISQRYSSVIDFAQDLINLISKAPILNVDCEQLEFTNIVPGRTASASFVIKNDGVGRLVGKLVSEQPWLEVSPATIELESDEQVIQTTINTSDFPPGFNGTGDINIVTNGGKKIIIVSLSISDTFASRTLLWLSHHKWLISLLIGIIIIAALAAVVYNTVFKETPASPASMTMLFEDDFGNPLSGWDIGIDSSGEGKYENGEYIFSISEGNYNIVGRTNDKIGQLSDFTLEVDARFASGPAATWYGIGFRQQDINNSYDFLINSGDSTNKASYTILKQINGNWSQLKNWTDSGYINKGRATNHLKITCKGDEIEIYVNDQKLIRLNDASFSKGAIVFEAAKDQGGKARVHFDNLRIYAPQYHANLYHIYAI